MKKLARIVALFLSILLTIPTVTVNASAEELTTEEAYWENIELLSIYMRNDPEAPVDIAALRLGFQSLHHYQLSTEFSLYAQIMEYLENDDFNNAMSWLSILVLYPEFDEFVTSEEFSRQYPEIRGVQEMETYINARREEAAHNYNAASTLYKSCLKFYDAMERYQNLYVDLDVVVAETLEQIKSGDYASAIANAEYLIANGHERGQALYDVAVAQRDAASVTPPPVATATPTPAATPSATPRIEAAAMTLTAGYSDSKAVLSWNAVPGAAKYIVYHARGKDKDMGTLDLITEITSTKYTDKSVITGMFNSYKVEAVDKNGNVVGRSSIESVYAVSKTWGAWSSWSTNTVSEDSTTQVERKTQYRSRSISATQQYSNWSAWSAWSTTAVAPSATMEVETQIQYRYRDTTYQTQYSEWSGWSDWSTTATSETSLRNVESKTETVVTKLYSYSRWKYYNTDRESTWYSYGKFTDTSNGYKSGSGSWQYKNNLTSPLATNGTVDGRTRYRDSSGGVWYNQTISEKSENVTYYRYRTRTTSSVPVLGAWSAWSSSSVSATSTREVETRTVYRYRTKTQETVQTYGSWSTWSDTPITENSTRQVETRTVYRYRKYQ